MYLLMAPGPQCMEPLGGNRAISTVINVNHRRLVEHSPLLFLRVSGDHQSCVASRSVALTGSEPAIAPGSLTPASVSGFDGEMRNSA